MKYITGGIAIIFVAIELLKYLSIAQNNSYALSLSPAFKRELLFSLLAFFASIPHYHLSAAVYGVAAGISLILYLKRRSKLVFTKRAATYYCISILFSIVTIGATFFIANKYIHLPSLAVVVYCSFLFVKVTELLFGPYYRRKNEKFIRGVTVLLQESKTKIIAITGSFGKTCCKNILKALLQGSFSVETTKGNYNTPMGVALSLKDSMGVDYFIAEFGARKKGDITELCNFYKPHIGIITGVCEQHLGVFGSFHTIYNEKFQLAKLTDKEGFCAFGNNLYAKKMYREYTGNKISVGACEEIYAEGINRSVGQTTFILHIREKYKKITTSLCGRQAIDNILLCVTVADKLGVNAEDIFNRIGSIPQIPHRLEYMYSAGVHILDDSYNANTVGIEYALDYLDLCPSPRIIVAQGVVEMGIKQKSENRMIGEKMAKVADVAIVTGVNRRYLRKGLSNAHFSGKIIVCRSFKAVKKKLPQFTRPGATVLFQNDVPETY